MDNLHAGQEFCYFIIVVSAFEEPTKLLFWALVDTKSCSLICFSRFLIVHYSYIDQHAHSFSTRSATILSVVITPFEEGKVNFRPFWSNCDSFSVTHVSLKRTSRGYIFAPDIIPWILFPCGINDLMSKNQKSEVYRIICTECSTVLQRWNKLPDSH